MNSTPNALYFADGLPASGAPCVVAVSADGLHIRPTGDSPLVEQLVSFADMSVEAGGLDHDQLVVSWGAGASVRTLYLKDPALIIAFRRAAPSALMARVEQAAEQVRRARHSHRALWGSAVGVVVGLGLMVWFGSDLIVEWVVVRIPVQWEQKLGETVYQDFLSKETVLKEGPAVSAVQEMTQRMTAKIPNNPYTFQVSVVQSPVSIDRINDIFRSYIMFPFAWRHFDDACFGIQAVVPHLRFKRILIGRKGLGFADDLIAVFGGAIKGHHEQVKVHGELVHHHHFIFLRTHDCRKLAGEDLMIRHPGFAGMKMSFHTKTGPVFQLIENIILRGFGLQAQ